MGVTTQQEGYTHVRLSDFSHICDLKIKELRLSVPKRWGRGGWLDQPSAREEAFNTPEETPDSQGETRSKVPKYALYSPTMHCPSIWKNQFPHGAPRG